MPPTASPNSLPPPPTTPQRPTRRYKTQLRDFLSTCRSKRKLQQQQTQQQPANMAQVRFPCPVDTIDHRAHSVGRREEFSSRGTTWPEITEHLTTQRLTAISTHYLGEFAGIGGRIYSRSKCGRRGRLLQFESNVRLVAVRTEHGEFVHDTFGAFVQFLSGQRESVSSVSFAKC